MPTSSSAKIPRKQKKDTNTNPDSSDDSDKGSSDDDNDDDDDDNDDEEAEESITAPTNINTQNISTKDIFSLLQMKAIQGASHHTAYRNKMTNEILNWFARASQDENGNNKTMSNNLETALESQHITGVCESIQ